MQTDPSHPAGCLVVLSTLTSAPENNHLQALLATERSANRAALAARVRRAVEQGDLPVQADADAMATLLDGYLVGLSTQARDGVPAQQLEAAVAQLMALWDAMAFNSRPQRSGSREPRPVASSLQNQAQELASAALQDGDVPAGLRAHELETTNPLSALHGRTSTGVDRSRKARHPAAPRKDTPR